MSFVKNSFLDGFEIPTVSNDDVKKVLNKTTKSHQVVKTVNLEKMPLNERLAYIENEVNKILGRYRNFVRVIRTEEDFDRYISKVTKVGYVAFDTETNNSLDPLTCKIMGLCFYIKNTKPVYVPINHTLPGTDTLRGGQISEQYAKIKLQQLSNSGAKIIYHNGKFDIRVIRNTLGVTLPIWWDTMIAAQLLDENEEAKLKYQYQTHIDPTMEVYNIEELFKGTPYAWISPETFALYAAIDTYDTLLLQEQQQRKFERPGMEKLYKLFREVEIPVTSVVSKMEDAGVCMDKQFVEKLLIKYNKELQRQQDALLEILRPYQDKIARYQQLGKLDNPINFESAPQLKIIMYDILGTAAGEHGEKKTDKSTLKHLKTPFTEALLEYRHVNKLLTSFLTPLPKLLSPRDGKLHANFNQLGREENNVRTGRFSSTNPNLQQIPSGEGIIRMMFEASPGCVMVGSDFSAQEPRLMAHLSGEEALRHNFEIGRDPYATISSLVFGKDYWECMETFEDGTSNPEGKALRGRAKVILLGILYGMGAKRMAAQLNVSVEESAEMLEKFFQMFPKIKAFTESNQKTVKKQGYVEDYIGRQRHLPDVWLPQLDIKCYRKEFTNVGVFPECSSEEELIEVIDTDKITEWQSRWNSLGNNVSLKDKQNFIKAAHSAGVVVTDNGNQIAKAVRQCTNARVQGSAASLTKKAMIAIDNDPEMKRLGYRLLIPIHDELLGECPAENAAAASERLSELMINAAIPECSVAMKCDAYVVGHWYADEIRNKVHRAFVLGTQENSPEEVYQELCKKYEVLPPDVVKQMCDNTFDVLTKNLT